MLKGVDAVLTGDLLKILDEMGHGDQLLLADRNFPAASTGKPVVRLGEITVLRAAQALFSVFPLDTFVPYPLARMEAYDDPDHVTESQARLIELAQADHSEPLEYEVIPRLEFYQRAKAVFAVVQTLDDTPYSCFILTKGVV